MVGILNRYLSVKQVEEKDLKVIGCACLLIASKIEDVYPAQSFDLCELSMHSFTPEQLFNWEIKIINAIKFNTTFPTPLFFLTIFMRLSDDFDQDMQLRARYFLEIMQSHMAFSGMKASEMASIAVYVTRYLQGLQPWTEKLWGYTGYTANRIKSSVKWIESIILEEDRPETRFMRRKYGSDLFHDVASIDWPNKM